MAAKKKAPAKRRVVLKGWLARGKDWGSPTLLLTRGKVPSEAPDTNCYGGIDYPEKFGLVEFSMCSPEFRRATGFIPRKGSAQRVTITLDLT